MESGLKYGVNGLVQESVSVEGKDRFGNFGLPAVHHLHRRGAEQLVRQEVNFLHYVGKSYRELLPQKDKGRLLTGVDGTWNRTVTFHTC